MARDLEWSSHFLFQDTTPELIQGDCGRPHKTLASIDGVLTEIWANHLSIQVRYVTTWTNFLRSYS
jgi:hypothetical protein